MSSAQPQVHHGGRTRRAVRCACLGAPPSTTILVADEVSAFTFPRARARPRAPLASLPTPRPAEAARGVTPQFALLFAARSPTRGGSPSRLQSADMRGYSPLRLFPRLGSAILLAQYSVTAVVFAQKGEKVPAEPLVVVPILV